MENHQFVFFEINMAQLYTYIYINKMIYNGNIIFKELLVFC